MRPERVLIPQDKAKYLIWPDTHVPHHDPVAVELMMEAAENFGVDGVIYLGDLLTFYSISSFDKDPAFAYDADNLQQEIEILRPLHAWSQKRKNGAIWLEGNHEKRYTRLISKIPGLRNTNHTIEALLGPALLDKTEYLRDDTRLVLNPDVILEHGHDVKYSLRPKGAADAVLLQYPEQTTIIGHTHRVFTAVKTVRGRSVPTLRRVFSVGHLCDEEKENYVLEPDWQQGFMIITCYMDSSGRNAYDYHQVTMNRDKRNRPSFCLAGKVYK